MGGHGGLNILPQKRWNVYNYENREKVRRDEEAAAKEEQLKQEQARKRDAEFRLERLRASRGLAPLTPAEPTPEAQPEELKASNNHINLFEGIKIFDPIKIESEKGQSENSKSKRAKREREEVRVVTAEDEKYRLGYGVAGKGVKLPWYLEKKGNGYNGKGQDMDEERGEKEEERQSGDKKRKKSLEELREERLQREKREKERECALLGEKNRLSRRETEGRRRFSRR